MAIEEYGSSMIPVFVTLGSLGILYPYFVEGFIIFSFVLLIGLVLLGKLFDVVHLKGYYSMLLASISVVFALAYFQKMTVLFMITGMLILISAMYSAYIAMREIKCPY